MNTTVVLAMAVIMIALSSLAFACARREDKKMENIHRRLKELEGKKEG